MLRIRCVLCTLIVMAVCVPGSAEGDNYWLVTQITGRWEYRVGTDKARQLTGRYEPLAPEGQVRCLEPDVRRCELRYLVNARSAATERLNLRLQETGEWVSLKRLKPPPPPVLPATSSELAAEFVRATRAGGSRAASGCGGDFPLKAPTCGENIDISNFEIRWTPTAAGNMTVLVERADGEPELFRRSAPAAGGQFASPDLNAFLRKFQDESTAVDIVIRVLAPGGGTAVRLVRIPPSSRTDDYEGRVRAIGSERSVPAVVTRMSLAMEEGMWSRAAEEASALVPLAAGARPILEYALVGACQSDFQEEKALLRKYLPGARYDAICTSPPSTTEAPAPSAPVSGAPESVSGSPAARTRTGIALLIGNYAYWNTPLNSVKSDLRSMSETLQALGFVVSTKENLRNPRQFVEAVDEVLKKEAATPEDVLLVYYSGHGVQLDGKAQLLSTGVSATARVAEDLRDNAQSAEDLLAQMERSVPGTRVLIVEACRNDVLTASPGASQAAKGGFAFQQDDVSNTFVMFANRPGSTTPVRSDYGLMGPFTEALVYALQNTTGEILDVYATAAKKTAEISPAQEPVLYRSKNIEPVVLRRPTQKFQDTRAKELLASAEAPYRARAWEEFQATVTRARALASESSLQQRLSNEMAFAKFVMQAEAAEDARTWSEAAANWQNARDLFAPREWVSMKAAIAWLLADDLPRGIRALAVLAAQSDSEFALRAKQMVADLIKAFPELEAEAANAARDAKKIPVGPEFEKISDEE